MRPVVKLVGLLVLAVALIGFLIYMPPDKRPVPGRWRVEVNDASGRQVCPGMELTDGQIREAGGGPLLDRLPADAKRITLTRE